MRSLQFANASGKFQINRKSRWVSPYKPHRPWATSGSGHTIPERILNWAIVSLKWFGWRSNQIVVSNWLLFESSSEEWLEPKIKLLLQSDSLASRLSFQDQMLLKFREGTDAEDILFPHCKWAITHHWSSVEKHLFFFFNNRPIEYFI